MGKPIYFYSYRVDAKGPDGKSDTLGWFNIQESKAHDYIRQAKEMGYTDFQIRKKRHEATPHQWSQGTSYYKNFFRPMMKDDRVEELEQERFFKSYGHPDSDWHADMKSVGLSSFPRTVKWPRSQETGREELFDACWKVDAGDAVSMIYTNRTRPQWVIRLTSWNVSQCEPVGN